MSYAWRIVGDALADLRDMPAMLQEDALDELERLSETPSALNVTATGYAVVELDRTTNGARHIVFLRLHRDDARQVITVLGVTAQRRP